MLKKSLLGITLIVGYVSVLGTNTFSQPITCDALVTEAAANRQNISLLESIYDSAQTGCDDPVVRALGKQVAISRYNDFSSGRLGEISPEKGIEFLEGTLRYAALWQVAAELADLHRELEDYDKVASYLQTALISIQDERLTPTPPSADVISSLVKKADIAVLLADKFVPTVTRSSDGTIVGINATVYRGIEVSARAKPIQFQTDSTDFAAGAAASLDALAETAQSRPDDALVIVGNADRRGTAEYNCRLSRARTAKIRDELVARGIKNKLTARAAGESRPFNHDGKSYSQSRIWAMDRRVDYCFGNSASCQELASVGCQG